MSIEKEFVPYEEALALKELGFDKPCLGWFKNRKFTASFNDLYMNPHERGKELEIIKAPLFSQTFRWFRERYNLHSSINLGVSDEQDRSGLEYDEYTFTIEGINGFDYDNYGHEEFSTSHEEAELACLKKLIELAKARG